MISEYLQTSQVVLPVAFLGVFIGYIGAEVASPALVERVLWPQRSSSGSNAGSIKNALFLSNGGSLHKVAIRAMDTLFIHGLHKGPGRGHLLGTAFFPDTGLAYKMYLGNGKPVEDELVRNGLLVRILKCISDTSALPKRIEGTARMRQQITVSHLELFNLENVPPRSAITLDSAGVNTQTILTLLASEIPTFLLVCAVGYLWSIPGAMIYLLPAILKILSACTAMQREDLIIPGDKEKQPWKASTEVSKFEIHIPGEGFQVISGPADLILPFFRHYGHPIRCRWRELTQMVILSVMGFTYTINFITTVIFMPPNIQSLWIAYQVYLTFAMIVSRYGGAEMWGSTEERIAQALTKSEKGHREGTVVLKNQTGEMIGARLRRTLHGSYSEGKSQVSQIIQN